MSSPWITLTLGLAYGLLLGVLALASALETAIGAMRLGQGSLSVTDQGVLRLSTSATARLERIRRNPFLQIQNTLFLTALLNLALAFFALRLGEVLAEQGVGNRLVLWSGLLGANIFLGAVLPKLIAMLRPDTTLLLVSRWLHPVQRTVNPLAKWVDLKVEGLLNRLSGLGIQDQLSMTQDEFDTFTEMRHDQGVISNEELSMIREVLAMTQLNVKDAMVPRVDLALVDSCESDVEIERQLERAAQRFIVIYRESPDAVEGVVDRHVWSFEGCPPWRQVLRPPIFVPETVSLLEVAEMRLKDPGRVVCILDEYGGLEGMLTQEEWVDWLLHEAAPWLGEDAELRELGEGRYLVDGGTRLDHIEEVLKIQWPVDLQVEGIDTIGGLVFRQAGRVPHAGECFDLGSVEARVRLVKRARIRQVEVRVNLQEQHETEDRL